MKIKVINNINLKFFIICIIYMFLTYISEYILNISKLYSSFLNEKFASDIVSEIINYNKKLETLQYLSLVLILIFKVSVISSVLYIGVFFNDSKTKLKNIYSIVLNAEFIFIISFIVKLIWFTFFQTNYKFIDIQFFYPLSSLNIVGYQNIDPWLIYPLQTLNLFEVAYIIYLSYQIGYLTKTNADNGLKIVGYSYVPALLLWVTVVMFFTLNYS